MDEATPFHMRVIINKVVSGQKADSLHRKK